MTGKHQTKRDRGGDLGRLARWHGFGQFAPALGVAAPGSRTRAESAVDPFGRDQAGVDPTQPPLAVQHWSRVSSQNTLLATMIVSASKPECGGSHHAVRPIPCTGVERSKSTP